MSTTSININTIKQITIDLVEMQLRAGHTLCSKIPTSSMWPLLAPGDRAIIRAVQPAELRIGDIVIARHGNIWIAHRLIQRQQIGTAELFVTKGDNTPNADEACLAENLIGVVITAQSHGREINLHSMTARALGNLLAQLSRTQWRVFRARPNLARRAILKITRVVMRWCGMLARKLG